jgi:tRNA threonylcarbamoyladenosine biosynthesis protein TsaB
MASVHANQNLMGVAPLILSFNTATLGGSVCLVRGNEILASISGDRAVSHSSTLLRDIDRALAGANLTLAEVELLAAAAGPGSFTGLRIGVASIKALSLTLRKPCFGIPTLHAIAHSAGPSNATVAVLPAGRGEVFAQLLSVSNTGMVMERDTPTHLSPPAMIEKYHSIIDLIWAGEGARLYREIIREAATGQGIVPGESSQITRGWMLASAEENLARDVAALAWQRFQSGRMESAESLQAIYVRPSDAELKANVSQ